MSTINDINNAFALDKRRGYPGSGGQPSGETEGTVAVSGQPAVAGQPALGSGGTDGVQPSTPYVPGRFYDFFTKNYEEPSKEAKEKEEKRRKRDSILASVGNALNAFHQAYTLSRGVKPITKNESLTGRIRDRYERLDREYEAKRREYAAAGLRAMQMDDEVARDERNWRRTLERDEESDRRDKRDFDERQRRADQQQENWQKTFERQGEQWKQEFEERKKRDGEQSALAWARHSLSVQAQKDNKELRQQQIAAQGARGVRGKQMAFSDGNGNNVAIYENVWKGSMEQVYDAIIEDFKAQKKANPKANVPYGLSSKATAQQKDDFVKQHWHKSAAGRQMMQTLSGIDPANMTSTTTTDGGGGLGWGAEGNGNDNETDW